MQHAPRNTHHALRTTQWIRLNRRYSILKPLAVAVVLLLALVNLDAYPATWFDEGQYLHVPKALIQHGVYADWSSEGPRPFGPTTAAGPTVLLPIAAAQWLLGTGLLQARLPMALYLIGALLLCYVVAARLFDRRVAVVAVALLLSSRGAATLEYGRQVQGEVPALLFVLAGVYGWHRALHDRSRWWALAAGVLWGVSMITKNQVAIVLTPALGLLALLDWIHYRNGGWSLRLWPPIVAVGLYVAWLLILFGLLTPGSAAENIAATRKATSGALIVLTPAAAGRALRFLVSPALYGGLMLPALLYGLWRSRRRDRITQARSAVVLIVGVWIAWFVTSLGWPRYAYIGVALGALLVAWLIVDVYDWTRQTRRPWISRAVALVTVALIVVPLTRTIDQIARPDRSVLRFAAYLDQAVGSDDLIETWEPELGGLTDHLYHYPPQALLDVAVRHQWQGTPPARYDLDELRAPYVIIGPFGAWTGVYDPQIIEQQYREVHRDGAYVLYRRQP